LSLPVVFDSSANEPLAMLSLPLVRLGIMKSPNATLSVPVTWDPHVEQPGYVNVPSHTLWLASW
jgi:hypothetical protein